MQLPPIEEWKKWETDKIAYKGDGVPFTMLTPDFEDYFEHVRRLAGEPVGGQPGGDSQSSTRNGSRPSKQVTAEG